ncbi:MAG: UvrD-helicase domain-containing protein [Zoogloeaceae bacterium]|jgi:DNA helicase-2/ATP-dependent DNA helicase PcrA|nr:UvrD-helicase domain-containing protein [Zoogloeaceae bacterium]
MTAEAPSARTPQSAKTLTDLNAPQQRAVALPVTQPPTHGLILAGAGSGKTRVLTTRIAWLLAGGQARAHEILAVTFTNKAAREMTTRLAAQTAVNVRSLWIGTFHGLCHRLLRLHYREANLPQSFQILDVTDQLAAIKRLCKTLNIDDEKYPPRELQYFINAHKEKGLRAGEVETWDDITRKKAEIYAEYEAQCQREGVVDFAELLLRAFELLSRNAPLRTHYQQRFQHILVDEFQDTNRLQYDWLKLLAGGGAAMFAVGDDDQSIYAFRGAEVGNMRDFEREFAGKQVIRLEQNYRSHGHILAAANALIQHNRERLGKELWTDAGAGEPIRVYEAASDQDEAGFVVDEARALVEEGSSRSQIAVLYRSNAQSRVLEHELFSRGVAYRVYGGLRFFERQEIKHALAYLRLIANPDDDTAFLRVVNFPTRGIGARSLENLQASARQINASLYTAAASLSGKAAVTVGGFVRLIESLRAAIVALSLPEQIEQVIEHSGLAGHYQNEKEGQERLENLDELINAAAVFAGSDEATHADESGGMLPAFLGYASLESGERQAGEGEEAVQLMTVHAAKGLEFDVVFITGLEQGLFPHDNAISDARGLEEERRLMYVAITRARQRLYLSSAQTRMLHGQTRYAMPSQFLVELPPECLKLLSRQKSARSDAAFWREGFVSFKRPPAAARERVDGAPEFPGGLKLGMNVRHAKFGFGVIIDAKGSGEEARVEVNFGSAGIKWLALAYAKLESAST